MGVSSGGARRRREFTAWEDSYLIENAGHMAWRKMADKLGRDHQSVRRRVAKLEREKLLEEEAVRERRARRTIEIAASERGKILSIERAPRETDCGKCGENGAVVARYELCGAVYLKAMCVCCGANSVPKAPQAWQGDREEIAALGAA